MPIAYLTLELRIEGAHSLKDKRQVVRSLSSGPRGGVGGPFLAWLRAPRLARILDELDKTSPKPILL